MEKITDFTRITEKSQIKRIRRRENLEIVWKSFQPKRNVLANNERR